jgi:hypothetical protein
VYIDLAPAPQKASVPSPNIQTDAEWRASLLERARALSLVPDVTAIDRLKAEFLKRGLGRGRDSETLAELDGYLDQAQRRQLAADARVLRRLQENAYFTALRQVAVELDTIREALGVRDVDSEAPSALHASVTGLVSRLRALEPPPELAPNHDRAVRALQEVATAFLPSDRDDTARTEEAVAAIDRTKIVLNEIVSKAS